MSAIKGSYCGKDLGLSLGRQHEYWLRSGALDGKCPGSSPSPLLACRQVGGLGRDTPLRHSLMLLGSIKVVLLCIV